MNSRDRFLKIMQSELPDRPPLFEDGLREGVMRTWRKQGLDKRKSLDLLFTFDKREEIEPVLDPIPSPKRWPTTINGIEKLARSLNPNDFQRLPNDWEIKKQQWKARDIPLILRLHRGYFLSMGVHGWHRFTNALELLVDEPKLVQCWMEIVGEFSAQLAENILNQIDVDAALFSEPIGGNHGPLISPKMYATFVVQNYRPTLQVLRKHGVKTIIYRTYANTRALLPVVVDAGFNCLWACETEPRAMNYIDIRREFGTALRLIGGIDSDSLRQSQEEIYRSVVQTVPPLLESGGFIPLADGRVREDVSFENYIYYRKLLESIVMGISENLLLMRGIQLIG